MTEKVAVIGAGSWGTAIARLLGQKGIEVRLWARDQQLAETAQVTRRNPHYLKNAILPRLVEVTSNMSRALEEATTVVFAVPSHAMRSIVHLAKDHVGLEALTISLAKGIEEKTLKRMSEVIADELSDQSDEMQNRLAALSGPNHAEEISRDVPSTTVIASPNRDTARRLQQLFMTSYFRVYTNPDMVGVELGGATKNVIAIAAGISDGLGYGDNTKASLMTRGLAEMSRLGRTLGAQSLTFSGLSGIGDLVATCTSRYSRNRGVGEKLGQGMSLEAILRQTTMVAEGIRTSRAISALAEKFDVEMPITSAVTEVLYSGKNPRDCVKDLMLRGAIDEMESYLLSEPKPK